MTYKISPDIDFDLAESTLAALDELQLLKGLADNCIATFTEYACQDVYAKCIGENVEDGLLYACKSSCEQVLEDCGPVLKQFGRESSLPKCEAVNFYEISYPTENCNPGSFGTSTNSTDTPDGASDKPSEEETSVNRPAALDIIIMTNNTSPDPRNCDPETGLCIRCPVVPYFYEKGAGQQENRLYLSMMLMSWITAFIPMMLMALNPQYRTYPALYLLLAAICLFLTFTVGSWAFFLTEEQWLAKACEVPESLPNVTNNLTCRFKSIFCSFFVTSANSWILIVMSSLHFKVVHRSNWIDDHWKWMHVLVWIPSAAISLSIFLTQEASYLPGLFCYPLGGKASRVYFIYLLLQSITSTILFAWTMGHVVYMSYMNKTIMSSASSKSTANKRLKKFIRPVCLVLWVTIVNLLHTVSLG